MGMNPGRPKSLSSDEVQRIADSLKEEPRETARSKRWTEYELAAAISAKALNGRRVILTPETAILVARALATASEKPTREQVARIICRWKTCDQCCYDCTGKANEIVAIYGQRRG